MASVAIQVRLPP